MNSRIKEKICEIEGNIKIIQEALPKNKSSFLYLGIIKDGIYKRL